MNTQHSIPRLCYIRYTTLGRKIFGLLFLLFSSLDRITEKSNGQQFVYNDVSGREERQRVCYMCRSSKMSASHRTHDFILFYITYYILYLYVSCVDVHHRMQQERRFCLTKTRKISYNIPRRRAYVL